MPDQVRCILSVAFLLLIGCVHASGGQRPSDEPAHVPNICSRGFCLEVGLLHDRTQRRFIKPAFEVTELTDRSQIKVTFEGFGQVIVDEDRAPSRIVRSGDPLEVPEPCSGDQLCRSLKILAFTVSGQATSDELKCRIIRIWFLKRNTYYVLNNSIGLPYGQIVSIRQVGEACRVADGVLD